MATMKDVAEKAGVSISTVSHVMNKTRFVSDELVARVLEAMEELNYRPNAVARSLRRKETRTIGLVVPDNANPFFAEVAKGAEDAGFRHGYSVILCNSDGDLEKELAYVDILVSKRVDGIIFIAATMTDEHIRPLLEDGVPLVIVDRKLPGIETDVVLSDNFRGGYQATRHLMELGHERIGCITGPSHLTPSADRVHGYRAACQDHGLRVDEWLIVRGDFRYQGGSEGADQLMRLPEPPTAIFACNDLMAIGALQALESQGVRVPEDIALVGFDDIKEASFIRPALTTVAQPKYEMGQIVVDLLMERLAGTALREREEIILETELVIRESTGPRRE